MLPETLQKGDKIAIIAPAKAIDEASVTYAINVIEERGFTAIVGPHCLGRVHYFSGTIEERTSDLQWAIDQPDIKAILCARGGYGSIHTLINVNWDSFLKNPKWLLGFSDATVFHQYFAKLGIASVHSTMPLNFKENSQEAIDSLFCSISAEKLTHQWETSMHNQKGTVTGELVGGNLTVLSCMVGTIHQPNYQDKILFLEDVGEHLYAIDRNLQQLKNAGILAEIKGLVVGDFANIKDTETPFGLSLEAIILSCFQETNIPIAFNFPGGHLNDNRALIFGKKAQLQVTGRQSKIEY